MSDALAKVVPIDSRRRAEALDTAFESLFAEHLGYVVHSLRLLGVQDCDVDDVAQEVFVAVHRRFAEYDPARPARAWLFSFAARFAANYRRLARHRHESDVDADTCPGETEPDGYRASQLAFLRRLLEQMTEERRIALIMHDVHGLTAPEIATVLEVPLNTVYSRVRRARKDLKRLAGRPPGKDRR